jgi:hypothetical protein
MSCPLENISNASQRMRFRQLRSPLCAYSIPGANVVHTQMWNATTPIIGMWNTLMALCP